MTSEAGFTKKTEANLPFHIHMAGHLQAAPLHRKKRQPKRSSFFGIMARSRTSQFFALLTSKYFQKWSEHGGALYILTSTCASRHSSVHFFDISTSKSAPTLTCFILFDLQMWFAPELRFHLSSGQLAPDPPL